MKVIVTGGFGALGRAVGAAFLGQGAQVALVDRSPAPDGLPDGAKPLGGFDLADPAGAEAAAQAAVAALGGLDVLVNVAGTFRWETVADGSPDSWAFLHAANLSTCLNMSRACLPRLGAGGAIVNIGANGALSAGTGMGAYAASKSAVHRLTEALAAEQKGRGIRVNAVLPGIIDTPANRKDMPDADPAGWTSPAAIADVILFLASPQSRAITGALVPVTAAAR